MKLTVIFLGTLSVVIAQEVYKFPQVKVIAAQKFAAPCAVKHNVDPGMLPRIMDGTLPRDEATNNYLYCFGINGGFIKEDGHLVIPRMAGLFKDHPMAEEYEKLLVKCNDVTKESPVATVVEINICLTRPENPVRFSL